MCNCIEFDCVVWDDGSNGDFKLIYDIIDVGNGSKIIRLRWFWYVVYY